MDSIKEKEDLYERKTIKAINNNKDIDDEDFTCSAK
jgi:hypothetical protein